MKNIISITKSHFEDYKSIYKIFVISSIIYFILSFALFSRTQDLPFDIILAMVYGMFGIPILGIFIIRKNMYLEDCFIFLDKKEVLAVIIYPLLIPYTIFILYIILRLPGEVYSISSLNDLTFFLMFWLVGIAMYLIMTHLSLALKNFQRSYKQFIWKVSIHLIYIIAYFALPDILNISIYYKDMFLIFALIIYCSHISIEILMNYSKQYF